MQKTKIHFENCYGIKLLDYEFDFTQKRTYAIYAPNGTMKTSFAKTFIDLSKGETSQDSIFKARVNVRSIANEAGNEIDPEQVFVIVPYAQEFKSKRISTLLVNQTLKDEFEKIHLDIDEKKEALLVELARSSGLKKGNTETVFANDITSDPKGFYKAILRLQDEVLDTTVSNYEDIVYNRIFNDKVVTFLGTKDFKDKLADYINKYNQLLESSTYFRKGIFNHNNAATIAKNLKDNGFFKANHKLSLSSKNTPITISTEAELEQVIQEEKDSILKNPELIKAFEEIDKNITTNVELRSFRDYLEKNPLILPELANLNLFKQRIWISYLKKNVDLYKALENQYRKGQGEIAKIQEQAKKEKTQWIDVVTEFNKRFFVPFVLTIENQEDVILKSELPTINFTFIDQADQITIQESDLFGVLSNGELRALYILNIIFEVEARRQSNQETLFVIDDIADSFDYKNKYAIIEYLKDISKVSFFNQVILTHNFDFYRTVSSRLDMDGSNKLHTVKTPSEIKLVREAYPQNPFLTWKQHLDNEAMLIASIPFVRNLAEYGGARAEFLKLTSLLHIKADTSTLTVNDLQSVFRNVLADKQTLILQNPNKIVLDLIFETADKILNNANEMIDLESKIVLAIAIRLKAEIFMIDKIADMDFVIAIKRHQTFKLYEEFKRRHPQDFASIHVLEDVNLMTPENIHLNSFMYEPILDMANEHLKRLYVTVKGLN